MAELKIDISDENIKNCFPQHGWALNSQGVKLLWLPILNLITHTNVIRTKSACEKTKYDQYNSVILRQLIGRLIYSNRELSFWLKECENYDFHEKDNKKMTHWMHASEMIPLFADLSIVYLRRIMDRFAEAISPVLFRNYRSAPKKLHKLIEKAKKHDLQDLDLICDEQKLLEALENHTNWIIKVRGFNEFSDKKGIRDSIEHRTVNLTVSWHGKSPNTRTELRLFSHSKDVPRVDLINYLTDILKGLCDLWYRIHLSINWSSCYDRWSSFPVRGNDDLVVSLWPSIGSDH